MKTSDLVPSKSVLEVRASVQRSLASLRITRRKTSVSHTACRWRLRLRYAFGRLAWLPAVGGNSLLRRVLGRTLGLQLFRMKDAVAAEAAIGQRLGFIFEGIGRSHCTVVVHGESLILLHKHKLHVSSGAFNGPGLYISSHAESLAMSLVPQRAQFFDGDVITLAVLHSGIGQVSQH